MRSRRANKLGRDSNPPPCGSWQTAQLLSLPGSAGAGSTPRGRAAVTLETKLHFVTNRTLPDEVAVSEQLELHSVCLQSCILNQTLTFKEQSLIWDRWSDLCVQTLMWDLWKMSQITGNKTLIIEVVMVFGHFSSDF